MIEFFPRQQEALAVLANDHPASVLLYGGAAGGAKSFTGCAWQISRRIKYPGTRGLIGRSKLDTLKKTTLKTFFDVMQIIGDRPMVAGEHYNYNQQSNIITFYNGSEIILKDLFAYPSDPNFDSLGSLEITDYFIDEAAQVTQKAAAIVSSRCRYLLNEYGLQPKGIMTCNPAKGWLYNDFYQPYRNGELAAHRAFVPALPGDNPHLPESYMEQLSRLPEQDRKRLRDGDWDYDESIDRLYAMDDVLRCFRDELLGGEKYITADVARFGKDRTTIGVWDGMTLTDVVVMHRSSITDVVAAIRGKINQHGINLSNVIADEDGVGGGVVDLLKCRGFVNGSRATMPDRYQNLKAECYYKLAEVIEQNKITFVGIDQHRDAIVKELDVIRRKNPDQDGKLAVTGKDEIQRMHGFSPDLADMIMMRMYFLLRPNYGKYSYA